MSQKMQKFLDKNSPRKPFDFCALSTVWTVLRIVRDLSFAIQALVISHKKNLVVKVLQIYHCH